MTNRKDWPLSVSTCWDPENRDLYKSLSSVGIRHVEYSFGGKDRINKFDLLNNYKKLIADMREFGITPLSFHLPFSPFKELDPSIPDKETRQKAVTYQSELIRICSEEGIPTAIIHPSAEPYSLFERAERLKNAVEMLRELADIAETLGVRLAVENLPRTCLTSVHEEHSLLLKEVPKAFACFDTNHSLRQSNVDFIKALGNRIIATHFSDYDMVDERHLLPFQGRNDWSGIMKALEEADYSGALTFEVPSKGVLTPETIILSYNKLMEA